ncbi:hypothetical protein HGM15179_013424, partial [Zosterops borbonicus]
GRFRCQFSDLCEQKEFRETSLFTGDTTQKLAYNGSSDRSFQEMPSAFAPQKEQLPGVPSISSRLKRASVLSRCL